MDTSTKPRTYHLRGETYVWVSAVALATILVITFALLAVLATQGASVFWPRRLQALTLQNGDRVLGTLSRTQATPEGGRRMLVRVGNRDVYGTDFRWIDDKDVTVRSFPDDALVLERREYGPFHGTVGELQLPGVTNASPSWTDLIAARAALVKPTRAFQTLDARIRRINDRAEVVRLTLLRRRYHGATEDSPAIARLVAQEARFREEFKKLADEQVTVFQGLLRPQAVFLDAAGKPRAIPLYNITRAYRPNAMGFFARLGHAVSRLGEILFDPPREANTEGGLFPAILGTVMMVFTMSIFAFPLGVVAAVYLREYATDGWLTRAIRIAVNNLAGIPSIVYGIFGLGFFVYGIGGSIDRLFFPERLPLPTFGTGGILWASLTLSLLTVPVVIVSTEEALGAIPADMRTGSFALGATKYQTLRQILLPMASPGILTGFILAMARAAGEVAPLMLTGVVKIAPSSPINGLFPYLHLNRKFMHLGFHIYDVGLQSPNVEAAKPMVFATAALLVLIVLAMSAVAIRTRTRMRARYTSNSF
jgi:phosphate transport system permease protein